MTDQQLSDLFAEGTAPESDAAFAHRVEARIGRERLAVRLGAVTFRAFVVLMLAGAAFVAAGVARPLLEQLLGGWSQFMGVPAPLVLAVLAAGMALGARRYVVSR
jgi:hypothetical protein